MSFDAVMPPYNASDPNASFLSSSCLDFLLIELVPMAYRVTNELEAAAEETSRSGAQDEAAATTSTKAPAVALAAAAPSVSSTTAGGTGTADSRKMDEDEERDAVFYRLESLGYRVGQGLVER